MDYKEITEKAREVVNQAVVFIRKERERLRTEDIESKGKNDFVTKIDKGSELILVKGLKNILKDSGFIAEEGTSTEKGAVYNWIIDPIDGTTNMIHGAPPYSVSVALAENDKIVVGIVHEISKDECFYSWKDSVAYLNGKEIKVSKVTKVADSLIATGFPYTDYSLMSEFNKTMDFFMKNSHGLRRLGSAAVDLAYVASGRYDAFYEYGLKAWDVAAGSFILQQAGGLVCDFNNGENYLFGKELIASNSNIFKEFSGIVSSLMKKN